MGKKLTTSGITVLVLGVIIALVGLIMFFSVFFSVFNMGFSEPDPFGPGFGNDFGPGFGGVNISRAFIGAPLFGLGCFLAKVGLGMTIAGQAGNAVKWYKNNVNDSSGSSNKCKQCGSDNNLQAKYCNACGQQLN
ncbi:zinc ribbon domain-containing protein [Alkalicella caledoniensis]|uniref:Zinc ribbon domain-containing protein n=1 Tax=Alkalicella caledoniensis TaxID=2731377 RepID=A0A7G9W5K4_ALKCA|nr:zinc ribbon domain-containing protein [Alkalicella caledoniensis]QNO13966.1 zinc ribbon domain-containing protein [Alkalicella caledoniensis]